MTFVSVAPQLPLVVAAGALGRTIVESVAEEGRRRDTRVVSVFIALACIALFLLELGDLSTRERLTAMSCAVTLWLLARVQRDARLVFAATGAVALLTGAEPLYGLGYVAALSLVLMSQRAMPARFLQRGGLIFVVGLGLGWLLFGARDKPVLDAAHALAWLDGALHAAGPVALMLASAGVVLAVLGTSGRRVQGATVLLALTATVPSGRFDATSAMLVALAMGLGLLEASAHLSTLQLPGARFVLGPLLALALVEPLSVRIAAADLRWPDLGPVPPSRSMVDRTPCIIRS